MPFLGVRIGMPGPFGGASSPGLPLDYFAADGASWTSYFIGTDSLYIASIDTTVWFWQGWTGTSSTAGRIVWGRGFNHTTQTLTGTFLVGIQTLGDDSHGDPLVGYDQNTGYIYPCYGSHATAQSISVSTNPNDITSWTALTQLAGQHSYPALLFPTTGANAGVAHLFTRNNSTASANFQLQLTKSTALASGVPTWGTVTPVIDLGSDSRADHGPTILAADGRNIHMVFCRPNNADTQRQDIFYIVYDTGDGLFYNIDRSFSTGTLPISLATMQANYRIVNQTGAGHFTDVPGFNFDSNGNSHVIYADGATTSGPWSLMHIMWNGSSWSSPVTVGAFPTLGALHRFDGMTVAPLPGGAVDLYWVTQSTVTFDRGGDISKVTRAANGTFGTQTLVRAATPTFALDQPIYTSATTGMPHANARVRYGETTGDETVESGALKSFAYGDGGPLKFNYNSTSRNLFSTLQPLASQKFAIDDFITTLLGTGLYAKMEVLYWALNDFTSGSINWINPGSFTLTKVGSPTFTALTSFAGDGSTSKYNTNFTPSLHATKATQNSMAIGVSVRGSDLGNDNYFDIGAVNTVNALLNTHQSANGAYRGALNDATNVNVGTSATSPGQFIFSRTGSVISNLYKNGTKVGSTDATASTGLANGSLHFCGTTTAWSARQVTDAFLSAGLIAAEANAFSWARLRLRELLSMVN